MRRREFIGGLRPDDPWRKLLSLRSRKRLRTWVEPMVATCGLSLRARKSAVPELLQAIGMASSMPWTMGVKR
jgi:hypothetical protein